MILENRIDRTVNTIYGTVYLTLWLKLIVLINSSSGLVDQDMKYNATAELNLTGDLSEYDIEDYF